MEKSLFKKNYQNNLNKNGFTLVELLIVIAILGILAAIAIPTYLGERTKAARTEAQSNLTSLRLVLEQYYAENGCYYKSTSGSCANGTLTLSQIKSTYNMFKPGDEKSLKFDYKLVISGDPSASGFTAKALGKSDTIVKNMTLCLNQNNEMTGGATCTW
ncbi:MAG: prepilin-type N-terminal cleavage/methylation domain-containing protein [Nitrospirae bacterium]|jgi:prepilin-type N-terminal cleavage/methylation domain-containing protein|nr:prepilin-type N-terminal cleavage/methylation domain-containing protein [Nitrospirota bacterium]